jgi:hypothetical protein
LRTFFKWLFKNQRSTDISSLIVVIISLFFINLFNYDYVRNLLFIPFLIGVIIGTRLCEDLVRKIIGKRNRNVASAYFYVSIFVVVTVTMIIKSYD